MSLACIKPIPVLRIPTYCATDGKSYKSYSPRWDAPGVIICTEARLELLSEHSRSKRCYTKKNKQYWESEGIVEQRDFDFIHIHKHNQHHTQIKNGGFIKKLQICRDSGKLLGQSRTKWVKVSILKSSRTNFETIKVTKINGYPTKKNPKN